MDIDILNKALNNENNESILNLTTEKINSMNKKILDELNLVEEIKELFLNKLKGYKYVDELKDIRTGTFIRWIPLMNQDKLVLSKGGLVCEIKITDDGIIIIYKNFINRYYQFKLDEVLCFQKLTNQEIILLSALDYLTK